MAKRKSNVKLQVTGRQVVYLQPVSKGGKLGKAKPFVATSVVAGKASTATKRRRKRK